MSRRRLLVAAAIVAAVVAALVLVLWHRRQGSSKVTGTGPQQAHAGPTGGVAKTIDKAKRRVAGTVYLEAAPAAGAIVRLVEPDGDQGASVTTDTAGHFDLGELAVGRYLVIAEVPRASGASVNLDLRDPAAQPPPDQLRLVLHACDGLLYGVIRDASGGTIANARVAESQRFIGGPGDDSNDDGAYELCVAAGDHIVTVAADGYASTFASVSVFGKVHRDFELIPEAVVAGRVIRAADNSPVDGARVVLAMARPAMDRLPYVFATSDADGKFRFRGVAPGSYEIGATAPQLAMPEPVEITADIGAPVEDVECSLVAALSISGRVVDKQKKPVTGVDVMAQGRTDWNLSRDRESPTQVDGSFLIDSLMPGDYVLRVDDVAMPKSASAVTLAKTNVEGLVLEVDTLGSIAGRVTRAGQPVEGASISARPTVQPKPDIRNYRPGSSATTDADGHFTLRGVSAGTYRLYAESKRVGAFTQGPEVALADAEAKTGVEVEMELAGSIAGTVVDQANTPVSGVHLRFSLLQGSDFGEATTDADGKFKATALSGGGDYAYEVRANSNADTAFKSADGKRFAPISVKDGNTQVSGVVIKLRYDRLTISGRVMSSTGAPVPDISVSADQDEDAMMPRWWMGASATTDTSGVFVIRDLPAGTYALHAHSSTSSKRVPNIAAGTKGVEIKLPGVGTIEGTVAGFSKPPRISAMGGEDMDMMTVPVRAVVTGNKFTIKNVTIGKHRVSAQSDDGYASAEVTVTAGGTATITLANKGFGAIEGRVVDQNQKPVADLRCRSMGGSGEATTDAAGTFHLERVPTGAQYVGCYGSNGIANNQVTVETNQIAHVDLVTRPRGFGNPGFAGVELQTQLSDVLVKSIVAGGPAERAGIKVGDAVKKVDGSSVDGRWGPENVLRRIEMRGAGETVKLTIERDDKEQVVDLKLDPPRDKP